MLQRWRIWHRLPFQDFDLENNEVTSTTSESHAYKRMTHEGQVASYLMPSALHCHRCFEPRSLLNSKCVGVPV